MTTKRRFIVAAAVLFLAAAGAAVGPNPPRAHALQLSAVVFAQQPAQPEQQDEFRPISELPPQDQLPAAPLLVTAYAVVMLALFAYLLSVARRLVGVQRELERLEADMKRRA